LLSSWQSISFAIEEDDKPARFLRFIRLLKESYLCRNEKIWKLPFREKFVGCCVKRMKLKFLGNSFPFLTAIRSTTTTTTDRLMPQPTGTDVCCTTTTTAAAIQQGGDI